MNLYLDIDGCVLYSPAQRQPANDCWGGQYLSPGLERFFELSAAYSCYWLSVWNLGGRISWIRDRLLSHLPPRAGKFRAGRWKKYKSQAIDPETPWVWVEDGFGPELGADYDFVRFTPCNAVRLVKALGDWRAEVIKLEPFSRSLFICLPEGGADWCMNAACDVLEEHQHFLAQLNRDTRSIEARARIESETWEIPYFLEKELKSGTHKTGVGVR